MTLLLLLAGVTRAGAQHHDTTHAMPGMQHDTMAMSMRGPLGVSMERSGSGTTWIPDATRLPSAHFMTGAWSVMLHGFVSGQYDAQRRPRGASQWGSLNWGMLMANRAAAGGQLQLRFMPSLDPVTIGECGYPLLLQTGETCNGAPLADRQHPHELFTELAALYERELTPSLAAYIYAAPAGEPALGPVAFMHRPSAMDEPQVPLGHHWQDGTHTVFGVVTAGLYTRTLRLEASAFNGREPDENRWNFDRLRLNSYSGRVTLNPDTNWSLSASYGYLDSHELANPEESLHRLVASAMFGRPLGRAGQWATTAIYGGNKHAGEAWSNSALLESEAVLDARNTVFGRAEYVQKSADELKLPLFPSEQLFGIRSLSLGYIRELTHGFGATLGIGARGTVNFVPGELESTYGSRTPIGAWLFLRVRPRF